MYIICIIYMYLTSYVILTNIGDWEGLAYRNTMISSLTSSTTYEPSFNPLVKYFTWHVVISTHAIWTRLFWVSEKYSFSPEEFQQRSGKDSVYIPVNPSAVGKKGRAYIYDVVHPSIHPFSYLLVLILYQSQ